MLAICPMHHKLNHSRRSRSAHSKNTAALSTPINRFAMGSCCSDCLHFVPFPVKSSNNCSSCDWWARLPSRHWSATCCSVAVRSRRSCPTYPCSDLRSQSSRATGQMMLIHRANPALPRTLGQPCCYCAIVESFFLFKYTLKASHIDLKTSGPVSCVPFFAYVF